MTKTRAARITGHPASKTTATSTRSAPGQAARKAAKPGAARDESAPGTIYLLAKVFHAIRALHVEPALKEHDLTPLQYTILNVVQRHNGLSSADLSRRFYVTPQTMGQVLTGLEKRGLLNRAENPDNRRILMITITPAGGALVRTCGRLVSAIEEDVFSALSAEELEALRARLAQIAISARGG